MLPLPPNHEFWQLFAMYSWLALILGYRQKFDAKSCQNEEKIQICSVKKLEGEQKKVDKPKT